jgi:hypothetical protein
VVVVAALVVIGAIVGRPFFFDFFAFDSCLNAFFAAFAAFLVALATGPRLITPRPPLAPIEPFENGFRYPGTLQASLPADLRANTVPSHSTCGIFGVAPLEHVTEQTFVSASQ